MEPLVVNTVVCESCGAELDATRESCPHCGEPAAEQAPAGAAPGLPLQSLLDNRKLLLLLLFGATAAMGLPFLWRSRAFSTWSKAALSVVVCLYTLLILWLFWLVMEWCLNSIRATLDW